MCIHIPQADWRIKPIYLNGNVYKGTYRRNHEGDYHCTERQVRAMIRDSFEDGNDGMLLEHYDMNDIDIDTLHRYRTLFQFRLMMFGKGLSVQERFANFRMDYLDFCNLIGDERYSDRLTYDGRWENNLYQFFSRVLPKVTADLPRPFRMEGIQRVDDTPQHKAVREAFTNAIIHSDLLMDAGILRVEKHDDRLCFRNPGLLKLPVEAIYRGGNSKARNPKIQNMLRMIGFGENVGSGFPKIIAAWKETNWGEPQLLNKLDVDEVELVLPVPSTKATSDTAPANAPANAPVKLNKTQIAIVKAIINNNHVTYDDLKTILGVDRSTITRNIAVLKEKGVIRRIGEDKNGYWEVLLDIKIVD